MRRRKSNGKDIRYRFGGTKRKKVYPGNDADAGREKEHDSRECEYKRKNDLNSDNRHSYRKNYHGNSYTSGGGLGMLPWQREKSISTLVIPAQATIFPQLNNEQHITNKEVVKPNMIESKGLQASTPKKKQKDNVTKSPMLISNNNSTSTNNQNNDNASAVVKNVDPKITPLIGTSSAADINCPVEIKEEKQDSSASDNDTSSSSDDSSSDEEQEPMVVLPTIIISPKKTSPLNIKLEKQQKPTSTAQIAKNPLNITSKPQQKTLLNAKPISLPQKPNQDTNKSVNSSSSSSSSSNKESPSTPKSSSKQQPAVKVIQKKQKENEIKKAKKKKNSEDDVTCLGHMENIIASEDDDEALDSDSHNEMEESTTSESTIEKTEVCLICDKKGHTSFQCQMICKNCSAPYHGLRTCPLPANLNTMLQYFMEFCMQQVQKYKPDTPNTQNATQPHVDSSLTRNTECAMQNVQNNKPDTADTQNPTTNSCSETNTQPQMDSSLTNSNRKSTKKRKRKHKTKDLNTKIKSHKRHNLSKVKKRKSEEDDDSDQYSSDDSEDSSSLSERKAKKKKLKISKSKNNSLSGFNLPNFMQNPINLPLVLNGFPNLTCSSANVTTNSNNPTNALSTLLLTHMLQNAIGSLQQQQ